jgi:hypothetical protein
MAKQGIWKKKEDGSIVFECTDTTTKNVTELTPEEMGLTKQAEFDVFFMKEVENPDEFEIKTKTFFVQHMTLKIREPISNLYLKLSDDRKYYVLDILHGMCLLCAFESDSTLEVTKSKPKKVSLEIVKEAMHDKTKPFYYFGRVEGSDAQNLLYGKTV